VTVVINVEVYDRLRRDRGVPDRDIKVSPTTRARIRKGLPVRESTVWKVVESIRDKQPEPMLAELLAS
jgi:hypothetical protein